MLQKFQNWTASHNPKWLALIRVALGAALLLRGVSFLNNLPELSKLIAKNDMSKYDTLITNSIPWIHIAGGFLIIIGILTRFAAFVQLPILLGAVLFINSRGSMFETNPIFLVIMVLLLLVFVIEGSGSLSLAQYFKEDEEEPEATAVE